MFIYVAFGEEFNTFVYITLMGKEKGRTEISKRQYLKESLSSVE